MPASLAYRTYSYRENLFGEFEKLVAEGKRFDGLIIDLMQTGFSLPMDVLVRFHGYARRLLKPQAVMLFIKNDGAITLTKDDPGGGLTMNVYDSPFGIFTRYPVLADYVCATVSGIDRRSLRGAGSTLANHILATSTPVLTPRGQDLKHTFEVPPPQNWLMQLIDDYSTTEGISRLMESRHKIPSDETLRLLQELEAEGIIYPIFSRIQFLANCYHNRKPFRLGRYMVAAGLITPSQLEELLELQQEEGWGRSQKTFLGLLAVRKGYINTRQLEVLLHDQYLYGGYHKVSDGEGDEIQKKRSIEAMRDSMIGSLGAIDCGGLLQSLSTARKTGLLTVENRDHTLMVAFSGGKPTHARMGGLRGYFALVEFLVGWNEGIFVFRDKGQSKDLDDTCAISQSLDRILLDSALAQDNVNTILKNLPSGKNVILERVWNFEELWLSSQSQPARYFDDTPVADQDRARILQLAHDIDGLTTLDEVNAQCEDWPTHMVLKAVQWLIDNKLVIVQQTSLFRPLTVFQRIASELQAYLGKEHNRALLEASLHYVHGANAAQRFHIDREGRVSVNLTQVKAAGTPVSAVLLELRRWMEAYLAYCRRQLDSETVDRVVASVVHGSV